MRHFGPNRWWKCAMSHDGPSPDVFLIDPRIAPADRSQQPLEVGGKSQSMEEAMRIEERHYLEALQLSEAMGNTRTNSGLQSYRTLARSSDPAIQQELQRLRLVRDAWVKVEHEQGPGSLLNLDHPLVPKHAGYGLISDEWIANAARYLLRS